MPVLQVYTITYKWPARSHIRYMVYPEIMYNLYMINNIYGNTSNLSVPIPLIINLQVF